MIKFKGTYDDKEVKKLIKTLQKELEPKKQNSILNLSIREAAKIFVEEIKSNVFTDTHNLEDNIIWKKANKKEKREAGIDTRHTAYIVGFKKGGTRYAFYEEWGTKHFQGSHSVEKAFYGAGSKTIDAAIAYIRKRLEKELRNGVKK